MADTPGDEERMQQSIKTCNIWTRYSNPLRGLNTLEIERMLQSARYGDDLKLQVAFYEIERNSPIFSICISKRAAGVLARKWAVLPEGSSPEAKAQAAAVNAMFKRADMKNKDGLTEALKHLVMYTFRGRAAVKPFIVDGELVLKKLDNWNFMSYAGVNYWNPQSQPVLFLGDQLSAWGQPYASSLQQAGLEVLPEGEVAYVEDDKPLDWAGISIYLRMLVGEEQWARAVEKFGIPQVLLKAPAGTPDTDMQKWDWRAQALFEGASGVLPSGTEAEVLTAARGQDPFTQYIQHQMEMFTILATGSTLATLGGTSGSSGAGLGSNLANVQSSQFTQLVNLDCKRISNALNVAVEKCCKSLGYQKTLCRFAFIEDEDIDVGEYLDYASKLQQIGVTLDIQKLKQLTKLDFIRDEVKDVWTPVREEPAQDGEENA